MIGGIGEIMLVPSRIFEIQIGCLINSWWANINCRPSESVPVSLPVAGNCPSQCAIRQIEVGCKKVTFGSMKLWWCCIYVGPELVWKWMPTRRRWKWWYFVGNLIAENQWRRSVNEMKALIYVLERQIRNGRDACWYLALTGKKFISDKYIRTKVRRKEWHGLTIYEDVCLTSSRIRYLVPCSNAFSSCPPL